MLLLVRCLQYGPQRPKQTRGLQRSCCQQLQMAASMLRLVQRGPRRMLWHQPLHRRPLMEPR